MENHQSNKQAEHDNAETECVQKLRMPDCLGRTFHEKWGEAKGNLTTQFNKQVENVASLPIKKGANVGVESDGFEKDPIVLNFCVLLSMEPYWLKNGFFNQGKGPAIVCF